jgi:hypothetical protein
LVTTAGRALQRVVSHPISRAAITNEHELAEAKLVSAPVFQRPAKARITGGIFRSLSAKKDAIFFPLSAAVPTGLIGPHEVPREKDGPKRRERKIGIGCLINSAFVARVFENSPQQIRRLSCHSNPLSSWAEARSG